MAKAAKEKEKDKEREGPLRHRKVGPYRVLKQVGRGGMAVVYRGIHEQLQREVALKELLPEALEDREAISRFRREALALAAFRHQNIVTLYDLVEKNDSLFMVMEFVDGPTLAELIKEGPLPTVVAALVGARLASALDHAHFNRIIHRDLKPSNVMVTKAGEVKLMDFGIAKDEGLEALTRQGMAVGTPSYMSPEQVTGAPVDHRTDLFSLGVVLYECLSGVRPFVGKSAGEVFSKVRDAKFIPLSRVAPGVDKALVRVVERSLKAKPGKRYEDAAQVRRELEVYLARQLKTSQAALLVAYLRHCNRLTETEARAKLNERELTAMAGFSQMKRRGGRALKWALALAAVAAAGSLYLTHAQWVRWLH